MIKRVLIRSVVAALVLAGLMTSSILAYATTIADDYVYVDGVRYLPGDEVVELRDQYSRTVYSGNGSYVLTSYIGSVYYEDNYGNFYAIDTTIVPSDRPNWDWEVTKGHWQLFIKNDTTIGVKKDNNWVGTRLHGIAYLDIKTKDYIILQTTKNVTPIVSDNKIEWKNILRGVDYVVYYTNDSFKEDIVVRQEARDYLSSVGHRPQDYGLDPQDTFLVPIFECDWSQSLPMQFPDGTTLDPNEAQFETERLLYFKSPTKDKYFDTNLVSFLPIGYAVSENPTNPNDPEEEWEYASQIIRKRLIKKDDRHWLLIGIRVTVFNQMPEGSIIFDPTETLRPDGVGDETNVQSQYPASTFHWDKVDEASPDINTYVRSTSGSYGRDLYQVADHSVGSDTINFIKVYARCIATGTPTQDSLKIAIKTGGTAYQTSGITITTSWANYSNQWTDNPKTEVAWTWDDIDALQIGVAIKEPYPGSVETYCTQVFVEVDYTPMNPPTVTSSAATSVEDTTATLRGNITATGGENCDYRGFVWGDNSLSDPGDVAPASSGYDNNWTESDSYGTGTFNHGVTSLPTGTTIYFRACAHNSAGWDYSNTQQSFLTKPAAPTNVQATDGAHTDKVVITWNKSTGATGYKVYEGANLLDTLGDVATYDDTAAPAGTISNAGTVTASDGTSAAHVALSLAGESTTNGASRTYKVVALNATGDSSDSTTNNGYRSVGSITYQWQRSAADSDADYGNISGATTDPYNDTGAPANGDGRYFQCIVSSVDASNTPQTSNNNRGYRMTTPTVTTQAATNIEDTTATGNGNITVTGNGNVDSWGICWNTTGNPDTGDNTVGGTGSGGTGAFTASLTGLPTGTTIHTKAYATNSAGTSYGAEEDFLTKPAAPTNVLATDGDHSDKVVVTWDKSTGATGYKVYEGENLLDTLGDVATYDDSAAPAGTIDNAGTVTASDGSSTAHVALSLASESTTAGASRTYKVVAFNATGDSDASSTNDGYRGAGSITYQWQRSTADYDNLLYNGNFEVGDPPTGWTYSGAGATHERSTEQVQVGSYSLKQIKVPDGAEAYCHAYQALANPTYYRGRTLTLGAWVYATEAVANVISIRDSEAGEGYGHHSATPGWEWLTATLTIDDAATYVRAYMSLYTDVTAYWDGAVLVEGDSVTEFSEYTSIAGATTDPYNDTGAPENGSGRYFQCIVSSVDASNSPQTSDSNRGFRAAPPTVTTQAATNIEDTTATGNGNITAIGGESCTIRGIVWDLSTHGDPGNVSPAASDYANDVAETPGPFGTGAFTRSLTSLPTGDIIYARAYAYNPTGGYAYGNEVNFLTKPAAPTNVAATDGDHTDKVVVTWTKSTGATQYQVYRDGTPLGWIGDVATYNDTGADAPTITAGSAVASDGSSTAHVSLSLSGTSTSNGTTHTYKVRAKNDTGESSDSGTNTGYRGVGSLTYQWQRSSGDSDDNYSNIDGAISSTHNDTGGPSNGDGRYYRCQLNAAGASQQYSSSNRGYRATGLDITTNAASNVEETTATLSGEVTAIYDTSIAERGFVWDTVTRTNPGDVAPGDSDYASYWTQVGTYPTEVFTYGLTSLTKGELYYVRACAKNNLGDWEYGDEITFLTKPDPPYGFSATATADGTITLTWDKGQGAQKTYIRGKQGSYPTDREDGYYVYFNTGTTTTDTGLTGGLTYYYRAWSYATEGALEQYSDNYVEDCALAIEVPSVTTNDVEDIKRTEATLSSEITNTGGQACNYRGFVWDTTSRGDPGSTAPADSDYASYNTEGGAYGVGTFTHSLSSLDESETYYVRGCAHNAIGGWSYGSEKSFTTLSFVLWLQPNTIVVNTNHDGAADAGSDNDTIIDDTLTQANDYWVGALVTIISADAEAPEGEARICTAYALSTTEITVSPAFSAAVATDDTYTIDFGTLPDRAGDNDAMITWGVSPVSVSVGGLESTGVAGVVVAEEPAPSDYVSETPAIDFFTESEGENIPVFYPIFKWASDTTGWPIQAFWLMGALTLSMLFGAVAMIYLHSMLIAGLVSMGITTVFCSIDMVPWWVLYVYVLMALTFIVYQRVVSA